MAWWIWAVGAVLLAVVEVVVPGWIFLGFAIGAGAMALMFLVGGPLAAGVGGSLPLALLAWAVLSVAAWLALRRLMGVRAGQVRHWDRDIND
jgi:inner membrane protein